MLQASGLLGEQFPLAAGLKHLAVDDGPDGATLSGDALEQDRLQRGVVSHELFDGCPEHGSMFAVCEQASLAFRRQDAAHPAKDGGRALCEAS
jgi:hypothetical protein